METPKISRKGVPKKLGRYEIQEPIGSGGMGMIFKGFDTKLKRPVAIKMISDKVRDQSVRANIRERFLNEARAAGALSHPHLVQIYDFGEFEDVTYIVMEFIEGETLEQLLKTKGPANPQQLFQVCREIAAGLAFAHQRGIVHRDIKPSNVIIEAQTGISKILDFGIAKFVNQEELKLTSTGMVLGSTHYLSPEHITGRNLDGRSDLFCLGILLYEAATGSLPFRGTNSSTILYKIVHFDPPPPHELRTQIDVELSKMIMRCLQKNPKDRFQRAEDLVLEIERIQNRLRSKTDPGSGELSKEAQLFRQSYFVRDSQLITALQTQKKISAEQAAFYRGKAVYPLLLRDSRVTEEELAAVVADCLSLTWIPKGRLKALKINPQAVQKLGSNFMKEFHLLPFFVDEDQKKMSWIIDGVTDFQKESAVIELFRQYEIKLYIAAQSIIQKLIESHTGEKLLDEETKSEILAEDFLEADSRAPKRVLLIESQKNAQTALISLFEGQESSLVICSELQRAQEKIKTENFQHIWINRQLIGDELAFESMIMKTQSSCDIRFYDHLGKELFEDSIPYNRFRDFFIRVIQMFLASGPKEQRKAAQDFGSLGVRIAKVVTESRKELDEVYFSALFYKWEKLRGLDQKLMDQLYGVYRFRHIRNCLPERFDGRGPQGLKGQQIPLATRVIAVLSIFERINPKLKAWDAEKLQELKTTYDQLSGKQIDPVLSAHVLDLLQPNQKAERAEIFIVDPDETFARELAAHLKRVQMKGIIFSNAAKAFKQLQKQTCHMVITEVATDGLDGFSFLSRIKSDAQLKQIPVVFVSRSQQSAHSTKALQLGAEDFISKTQDIQFLIAKLERLLPS